MKKLLTLIKSSVMMPSGKASSTRIVSYSISIMIILFCMMFLGFEIYRFCILPKWYIIPNEIIIIFGSLLAQQLSLLGITKYNESKQKKIENDKTKD
jgi:membrane protein YdbS with pleckstrin-like domain